MYKAMLFWETASAEADEPPVFYDYAGIWRAAEKVVYSRTLQTVSSARTRIEREFDRDAALRLKQSSGPTSQSGVPSSPTTSACNSNFSMSAGSETASFTSTTA